MNPAKSALVKKLLIQVLFVMAEPLTIDDLQKLLSQAIQAEGQGTISNGELMALILDEREALRALGLELSLSNGVVDLATAKIENPVIREFLAPTAPSKEFNSTLLQVLVCIAWKQPVTQLEIDGNFGTCKRLAVLKLRNLGMVSAKRGEHGALYYSVTPEFEKRFGDPREIFTAAGMPAQPLTTSAPKESEKSDGLFSL